VIDIVITDDCEVMMTIIVIVDVFVVIVDDDGRLSVIVRVIGCYKCYCGRVIVQLFIMIDI